MGLLDPPQSVLSWLDAWAAKILAPQARVACWALIGAVLATEIYRWSSPQRRLADLKLEFRDTERRLNKAPESLREAWPLIRKMLRLSLERIWLVVPATLWTGIPILVLLLWMNASYGHRFPTPEETVAVEISEPGYRGDWRRDAPGTGVAVVTGPTGDILARVSPAAAIPRIKKWRLWNLLIGNPAGYLPAAAPIEGIEISFPSQELLPIGPDWVRRWEFTFLLLLFLFAMTFKKIRKIE